MVNPFKVKKYAAFILAGFLPAILMFVALLQWGITYGYLLFFAGVVLAVVLGTKLLDNPFMGMLEGSGLVIFTFDSTGVIKPFLARVNPPYLKSNVHGRNFSTVFDRNTVSYLATPQEAEVTQEKETIKIELPKDQYNNALFSFSGTFPVLVYNSILGEFYTKEMLSKLETETFVQHLVLYLNRKVDELSNSVRDFARYVVEQTKPKMNIFQSKVFWIVIIVAIALLLLLFAPQIMKTLGQVNIPSLPSEPITPVVT